MLDLFVYLCILHLIHRNVIFDILEPHAFQKYSTYSVFKHFVFVYLHNCVLYYTILY